MRRLASEFAAFALLAACSTYDELAPLPPDLPIESLSGSAGAGTPGGSSTTSGGAPAASGSSSSLGGAASGSGSGGVEPGSGSGGTESGSGSGGAAAGGGQGGMPTACADCAALKSALVHRYDFEGTGTAVKDRVGNAHGTVQGATLSVVNGKGAVVLSGGATGPYVDLPNGLLSSLANATLEAWVTWGGGKAWQRIFDFGDSTDPMPENNPAGGKSYLFLTPTTDAGSGAVMRVAYSLNGGLDANETRVSGTVALPQTLAQVAVVVDTKSKELRLYLNGVSVGSQTFTGALADVHDVNAWLGRSQYDADPELTGTFHDFRVYGAALSASQIAASFAGGPDPAFLLE